MTSIVLFFEKHANAVGQGREEDLTKLLYDPQTRRILGVGIVGSNAGELIAQAVLALEMGFQREIEAVLGQRARRGQAREGCTDR